MNQLIPLTPAPNQSFNVPLNIDDSIVDLYFKLRYNEIANYWVVTIADSTGLVLLDSIPFVTGENILGQFAYMGIGSAVIINASSVASPNYPNQYDLGGDFVLAWGDTPGFAAPLTT